MQFLLLLFAAAALAAQYNNQTVCVGPYALCSGAYCETIPGNSTHVNCACYGPFVGLNSGMKTSCEDRTDSLISTFSLKNQYTPSADGAPPSYPGPRGAGNGWTDRNAWNNRNASLPTRYAFPCEGSNAGQWAQCRDAPCSIDSASGNVTCTCPLQAASANFYFGPECPASEGGMSQLCLSLRATSSLPTGVTAEELPMDIVESTLGPFYGVPPVIDTCIAPSNSSTS